MHRQTMIAYGYDGRALTPAYGAPARLHFLCVAPLDELIAYKQLLGRERDVADLLRVRTSVTDLA